MIGSRGLGSVEEYLLGSVSHKVTACADARCWWSEAAGLPQRIARRPAAPSSEQARSFMKAIDRTASLEW